MPDWTDGYVAEIDYSHAFYPEIAPALLSFALLLKGFRPPVRSGQGFSYCELGCGQGLSSNLLAAVHPEGSFHAVDFLPSHMAGARLLAEAAGSGNVTFLDDSFAEFAVRPGPQFDIIALHGVWSWVSAENRAILLDILRRRLKPGGAVYVSYNCLPGWAADMPVRHLLREQVAAATGPLSERIGQAIRALRRLAEAGGYFARVPAAAAHLESLRGKSASYIAHEYLNRDWAPFYHAEVADSMASARLTFAASATMLDHLDDWRLDSDSMALVEAEADPLRRETLRDTLAYTRFRRDIFVRGPLRLAASEREQLLRVQHFALCVPPDEVPESVSTARGEMVLTPSLYGPLVEALAEGPRPLERMLALPALAGERFETVLRALVALTGLGVVAPCPDPADAELRARRAADFNAAVLAANRHAPDLRQLASPLAGTGVMVDALDRLFLLAEQEGADPPALAWSILTGRGTSLRRDGQVLQTQEDNLAEMRRLHARFLRRRRPHLQSLGIVGKFDTSV